MYKIYTIFLKKISKNFKKLDISSFKPKNLTLQNLIKQGFFRKKYITI